MKHYLTIDIGGTFIKYGLMGEDWRSPEEKTQATQKDPLLFLEQVKSIVRDYGNRIEGIAICMAGFIDPVTGDNTDYSVGENFRTYNLKKELEDLTGKRVVVENDSNCAALGEMLAGAAKGCRDFCLITLGTGIGGAIVIDGRLVRGRHFKAGEVGQIRLWGNPGSEESCESAGATSALVRKVSGMLGREVDGRYIFGHLDEKRIADIYGEWLEKVALTAGNMAMTLDPELLLVGGGVCSQKRLIDDLRERVYGLYPHLEEYTEIRACETGNLAGRIGALSLLLKEVRK